MGRRRRENNGAYGTVDRVGLRIRVAGAARQRNLDGNIVVLEVLARVEPGMVVKRVKKMRETATYEARSELM